MRDNVVTYANPAAVTNYAFVYLAIIVPTTFFGNIKLLTVMKFGVSVSPWRLTFKG